MWYIYWKCSKTQRLSANVASEDYEKVSEQIIIWIREFKFLNVDTRFLVHMLGDNSQ